MDPEVYTESEKNKQVLLVLSSYLAKLSTKWRMQKWVLKTS